VKHKGSWVNLDLGCGLAALSPLLPHQEVTALLRLLSRSGLSAKASDSREETGTSSAIAGIGDFFKLSIIMKEHSHLRLSSADHYAIREKRLYDNSYGSVPPPPTQDAPRSIFGVELTPPAQIMRRRKWLTWRCCTVFSCICAVCAMCVFDGRVWQMRNSTLTLSH
jgi:hypothetical protein